MLRASDATEGDGFGMCVALDRGASASVIGASTSLGGAAYFFTRPGAWSQEAKVLSSRPRQGLGVACSMTNDGHSALIGAVDGAFVFTR